MLKLKYQTHRIVQALTRHFQDSEPISFICAERRESPPIPSTSL